MPKVSLANLAHFALVGFNATPSFLPQIEVFTFPIRLGQIQRCRGSNVMDTYLDDRLVRLRLDIAHLSAASPGALQ